MKVLSLLLVSSLFFFTEITILGDDYYRSNSIGMVFEKIPDYRLDEFTWIIKLSNTGSFETRVIYFNGEEKTRFEYLKEDNLLTVSEYIGDELVRIEKQVDGLVIREEYYKDNRSFSTFIYKWSEDQLQKITYMENDIHIYDDIFIVGNHGRIKQIRRIYEVGNLSTSEFGYSNHGISTEWHGTDNGSSIYRYENGKVVQIENWQDGILNRTKTFTATDSGSIVTEHDFLTDIENKQLFDSDDKILSSETRDGSNVQKSTYIYEGDLLVERRIASSGIREKHLFSYNSDNSLKYEKILINNMLIKEIFYDFGEKEEEKIYRNNSLLLIVLYKNGEKIGEERIQ